MPPEISTPTYDQILTLSMICSDISISFLTNTFFALINIRVKNGLSANKIIQKVQLKLQKVVLQRRNKYSYSDPFLEWLLHRPSKQILKFHFSKLKSTSVSEHVYSYAQELHAFAYCFQFMNRFEQSCSCVSPNYPHEFGEVFWGRVAARPLAH